jgi:hypothetical protein
MNPQIQAIPTHYDGIKFRSRAEARWAVFFKTLGIKYHYEPEGFVLPSGPYLPDFHIPHLDCYIEIKGAEPTSQDIDKASELATATGKKVYVFWGPLVAPDFAGECAHVYFPGGGVDHPHVWCECDGCGALGIQFEGRSDRINCRCGKPADRDAGENHKSVRLESAYSTARRERFGT